MAGRTRTTKPENNTDATTVAEDNTATPEVEMTDTTATDLVTDADVDPAEDVVTDAPAEDSGETTETAEKAPVEKYDIAPFDTALDAAISSNSDYNAEGVFDSVMGIYEGADRKGRAAITRRLNDRIHEAIMDADKAAWAPGYGVLLKALDEFKAPAKSATGTRGRPRKAVDPTELFVEKYASFQLSLALLASNKPEGLAEDWEAKATATYQENFATADALYKFKLDPKSEGDAPETSDIGNRAVKFASRTSTAPVTSGEREHHDVGKHIAEVAAGLESGKSLTATEIAALNSEEYGETTPTRSAIVSWLNREANAAAIAELGLTVVGADERGKLGVSKS